MKNICTFLHIQMYAMSRKILLTITITMCTPKFHPASSLKSVLNAEWRTSMSAMQFSLFLILN